MKELLTKIALYAAAALGLMAIGYYIHYLQSKGPPPSATHIEVNIDSLKDEWMQLTVSRERYDSVVQSDSVLKRMLASRPRVVRDTAWIYDTPDDWVPPSYVERYDVDTGWNLGATIRVKSGTRDSTYKRRAKVVMKASLYAPYGILRLKMLGMTPFDIDVPPEIIREEKRTLFMFGPLLGLSSARAGGGWQAIVSERFTFGSLYQKGLPPTYLGGYLLRF